MGFSVAAQDSPDATPPIKQSKAWLSGKMSHVADGDTFWLKTTQGERMKVRIATIDAPEICQAWGAQARAALQEKLAGQVLSLERLTHDSYGRELVRVYVNGEDVGRWLVAQGHAWSYGTARHPSLYTPDALRARRRALGLWAAPEPAEKPRDFRHRHGSCYPSR